MSKRARTLILGVTLAAMNLAGMTAVAHAHPLDPAADHADASQRQPTDAVERFRRGERASQEQPTADAALRRLLARERSSIPSGTPAQVPAPVQPDEPSGQAGWLVASLGVLAAVLVLIAGLAVLAAKRAGRRARAGQAA
jgi:hypothetical protein